MHGERALRKVGEQIFPAAKDVELERLIVGYRPWPKDGMPIVGRLNTAPDVYLATMHSGVTLAPIIGQYVTRELLANIPVRMLDPYRPDRFATEA
jgi:glycine/D-amino acid oxidase-like deaminating enzyme